MSDLDDLLGLPTSKNDNDVAEEMKVKPSFNELFEEEATSGVNKDLDVNEEFKEVTVLKGKVNKSVLSDKFYNKVLNGEGEEAQRLHSALANFLKAKDPQDKTMFRGRFEPTVWELYTAIGQKVGNALPIEKRFFMRYALLLTKLLNNTQKENIASIIEKNIYGEPVHYVDEWLEMVAIGEVNPLASDEEPIKATKSKGNSAQRMQRDKVQGSLDSKLSSIRGYQTKRSDLEKSIMANLKTLANHTTHAVFPSVESAYTMVQKNALTDLLQLAKSLQKLDREYSVSLQDTKMVQDKLDKLNVELQDNGRVNTVTTGQLKKEIINIRQIHKMCVGRQGNHFPMLHGNYITSNFNDIATREQIINILKYVEGIDPGVFRRTHRRQTFRIVPHVIIIPCYGDRGVCWEPFEKFNRATSRGRVAVPLFPKSIKLAVITALADLRWEVAKAKAQYYWMEEGITGRYFQWFEEKKMRGDVKQKFIEDYILWVTKESEGTQKLDKEVRGIFWRNLPFAKPVRENLKNRGFVYSELYKKDINREMSDGY